MKRTSLALQRRQFITLLGGAATWPLLASALQAERMRRVGVLSAVAENDASEQRRQAAFRRRLDELGWKGGRNGQCDLEAFEHALVKVGELGRARLRIGTRGRSA